MVRTAQCQQVHGLTVKSRLQSSGLESDLLWDYMTMSRHVGRARCGQSLMQGWGGRRSGRATHACPLRLPWSAGSLRLGCGGKETLADCSTKVLLENQHRPRCPASRVTLREFTVNPLNGWLDIRKLANMAQRERVCILLGLAENASRDDTLLSNSTYANSFRKHCKKGITHNRQIIIIRI